MIEGLINRQITSVLLDPYANAFYRNEYEGERTWSSDNTYKLGFLNTKVKAMNSLIHERKYELDSLCAVMRLSAGYFEKSGGNLTPFNEKWVEAIELILETIIEEQKGTAETTAVQKYTFSRQSVDMHETLHHSRSCAPNKRCGLSKSYFRPSDDSCKLPYLIPSNAMAVSTLNGILPIIKKLNLQNLEKRVVSLRDELKEAIQSNGIQKGIFAYETDGYGNAYFTDDANVPSLLSLPYLGYLSKNDPIYLRTRSFILSENNPWYFSGRVAKGIGSPHTGLDYIWPMSLTMQALTSDSDEEILECLEMLKKSTAGTYFMHEGFKKDDASQFTRAWFAWANTLFGELIYTLSIERPHLIF